MIFAAPYLGARGLQADAKGCRQFSDGVGMLAQRRRAGTLPRLSILALGANGPVSPAQIAGALSTVGPTRVLGLVTPRKYESTVAAMRRAARAHPDRVLLIDWVAYSGAHGGWFGEDKIHVNDTGARAFASLVATRTRGVPAAGDVAAGPALEPRDQGVRDRAPLRRPAARARGPRCAARDLRPGAGARPPHADPGHARLARLRLARRRRPLAGRLRPRRPQGGRRYGAPVKSLALLALALAPVAAGEARPGAASAPAASRAATAIAARGDAALAAAQPPALSITAGDDERGWIDLTVAGPAGAQVRLSEDGTEFATVAAGVKQPRALPWRCDKRSRVIVATAAAPDGTPLQAQTTVRTPSCDGRFRVSLDPRTGFRAGRTRARDRARRLADRQDAGPCLPARARELGLPQPPGARHGAAARRPHGRRDRHALRCGLPRQRAARGPRSEAAGAGHRRLDDPDRRRLPRSRASATAPASPATPASRPGSRRR